MNFTPMLDGNKKLYDFVFPKDEYEFKVVWAREKISKKNNEMIEIVLHVYNNDKTIKVYDYLLEAMAFKIQHFCETTGLENAYADGILTAKMCVGRTGRCLIKVETSGKYKDKNVVEDYCRDEESPF